MLLKQTGPARRLSSSNEAFLTDTFHLLFFAPFFSRFFLFFLLPFSCLTLDRRARLFLHGEEPHTDPGRFSGRPAEAISPYSGHLASVRSCGTIKDINPKIKKVNINSMLANFHILMLWLPLTSCAMPYFCAT